MASLCDLAAQGTAFTYQGRLADGERPANGTYDFMASLHGSASEGVALAPLQFFPGVGVTNGLFSLTLDFGAGAFNSASRWIEVSVRTNGGGNITTLSPRRPVLASPLAIFAGTAATALSVPASAITGTIASSNLPAVSWDGGLLTNLNASRLATGTIPDGLLSTNIARLADVDLMLAETSDDLQAQIDTLGAQILGVAMSVPASANVGADSAPNLAAATWDGGSLTNLNASRLASGTIPDGRLSTNIARLADVDLMLVETSDDLRAEIDTLAAQILGVAMSVPASANVGADSASNLSAPSWDGGSLTNLNASRLATGTIPDGRLSTNIARLADVDSMLVETSDVLRAQMDTLAARLAGVAMSVTSVPASSIVGTLALSNLPPLAVDGSGLLGLNASQLASGTIPDARLSTNIARLVDMDSRFGDVDSRLVTSSGGLQVQIDTLSAQLRGVAMTVTSVPASAIVGTLALSNLPTLAVDGSALLGLNASELATGTIPEGRLSTNIARLADLDTRLLTSSNGLQAQIDTLAARGTGGGVAATSVPASAIVGVLALSNLPPLAVDGSGLVSLNASQLASGTIPEGRLAGNIARLGDVDARLLTSSNGLQMQIDTLVARTSVPASAIVGTLALSNLPPLAVDGSGLLGLNASQLASGTIPDGRLAANIPRQADVDSRLLVASNGLQGQINGLVARTSVPASAVVGTLALSNLPPLVVDGSGLTSLNASQLASGTIPDGRLSANVAKLVDVNSRLLTSSNGLQAQIDALVARTTGMAVTVTSVPASAVVGTLAIANLPPLAVDGSGLSSLNASQLGSGTVPDGRLGPQVARVAMVESMVASASNSLSGRLYATQDTLQAQINGLSSRLDAFLAASYPANGLVAPSLPSGLIVASPISANVSLLSQGLVQFARMEAPGWSTGATLNAPGARHAHGAVWTGSSMMVWGGLSGTIPLNSGGIYDAGNDAWTTIVTVGAPAARRGHALAWTGSRLVVWGGQSDAFLATGGLYSPTNQSWTATATAGAPQGRTEHAYAWTTARLFVWGGRNEDGLLSDGATYDPIGNLWQATPAIGAPAARRGATATWCGDRVIVFGGQGTAGELNTGAMLPFAGGVTQGTWQPLSTTGAPLARQGHTAVWTGTRLIVWGGKVGGVPLDSGAAYDPATDTWTALPTENAPSARSGHVAVWTGREMVVFGGEDSTGALVTGGGYDPATGLWHNLTTAGNALARRGHTGVWTGAELVVFGGLGTGSSPTAMAAVQRLMPEATWYFYRKP